MRRIAQVFWLVNVSLLHYNLAAHETKQKGLCWIWSLHNVHLDIYCKALRSKSTQQHQIELFAFNFVSCQYLSQYKKRSRMHHRKVCQTLNPCEQFTLMVNEITPSATIHLNYILKWFFLFCYGIPSFLFQFNLILLLLLLLFITKTTTTKKRIKMRFHRGIKIADEFNAIRTQERIAFADTLQSITFTGQMKMKTLNIYYGNEWMRAENEHTQQ